MLGLLRRDDATKARGAKSDDNYKDGSFEAFKNDNRNKDRDLPVTVGTFERFGLGRRGDHTAGVGSPGLGT